MKSPPSIPALGDVRDELLDGGHLWLREYVDGGRLRFQVCDNGEIRFGDGDAVFDPGGAPLQYRHALRHVREHLDRNALRAAVDDVESVTFVGVATFRRTIEYDWERTPSFLGVDVWSGSEATFLPPDRIEQVYQKLGLEPINAVQKELRAQDFDPDVYEIPDSNWYDGAAAGVDVRNKTGGAATLLAPEFGARDPVPHSDATPETLVERHATDRTLDRVVTALRSRERPVTVESVIERALETVARDAGERQFTGNDAVEAGALRAALAGRVRKFLDDYEWE